MATVEAPAAGIPVLNPATGEQIATVPVTSAEEVRAIVARARAAQPAWEELGFEGRAKVLRRAQKWVVDNQDRIVATIVSETGKTHDDAVLNEIGYAPTRSASGPSTPPATWPTRRSAPRARSSPAASSSCATGRSA